jgi:hypothetical protein
LDPVITMLESDVDEEIGFTLASARKRAHGTAR